MGKKIKLEKEKGKCDCCDEKVSLKKLTFDENFLIYICDDCLLLNQFSEEDFSDEEDDIIEFQNEYCRNLLKNEAI